MMAVTGAHSLASGPSLRKQSGLRRVSGVVLLLSLAISLSFFTLCAADHKAEFVAWFKENGGYAHKNVAIQNVDKIVGDGVFATGKIKANATVFSVPANLIVVPGAAKTNASRYMDFLMNDDAYLMLFCILERRNASSWWAPYMRVLPAEEKAMQFPTFFEGSEIDALQASIVKKWITLRQEEMATYYKHFMQDIVGLKKDPIVVDALSEKSFGWAFGMMHSRAVTITVEGARRSALVPYVDLLNTDVPGKVNINCKFVDDKFVCRTTAAVEKGAQLLVGYGPYLDRPNSRLLLDYGFLLPLTVHDIAVIGPPRRFAEDEEPDDDAAEVLREEWLEKDKDEHKMDEFNVGYKSGVDLDLIRYARVLCATADSLSPANSKATAAKLDKDEPLSDAEETCMTKLLLRHLQNVIASYSTTLEADFKELRQLVADKSSLDAESTRRLMILQLLIGEKVALHDSIYGQGAALEMLAAIDAKKGTSGSEKTNSANKDESFEEETDKENSGKDEL